MNILNLVQKNKWKIVWILAIATIFGAYQNAGLLDQTFEGQNSIVSIIGNTVYKDVKGGGSLADALADRHNQVADLLPNLVPRIARVGDQGMIQQKVEGYDRESLQNLLNSQDRQADYSKAMTQAENAVEVANKAMGVKWQGQEMGRHDWIGLENGRRVGIDVNYDNFRWDADGNLTSWFDPVWMRPGNADIGNPAGNLPSHLPNPPSFLSNANEAHFQVELQSGMHFGVGFKSATFLLGFSSGLDSIAGTQIFFDQLGLATNDYQRVNIAADFLGSASANLFVGSSTAAAVEGAVTLGWIGAGAAVTGGALFGAAMLFVDYNRDPAAFGDKVATTERGFKNFGALFDRMTDSFSPPPLQFSNSGDSQVGALGATIKAYVDIAGGQPYDQTTKDSPVFQDIVSAREAGSRINELLSRESLTPENLKLADDSLSEFETRLHRISLQADKDPKSVPKSFDVYAERRFLVAAKIGRKEFVNGKIVKTNRSKDGPSPRSPYQVAKAPARGTPAQIGGGLGGLTPAAAPSLATPPSTLCLAM